MTRVDLEPLPGHRRSRGVPAGPPSAWTAFAVNGAAVTTALAVGLGVGTGLFPRMIAGASLVFVPVLQVRRMALRLPPSLPEVMTVAVWAYSLPAIVVVLSTNDWGLVLGGLSVAPVVAGIVALLLPGQSSAFPAPTIDPAHARVLRQLSLWLAVLGLLLFGWFLRSAWGGTRESLFLAEAKGLGFASFGTHLVVAGLVLAAIVDLSNSTGRRLSTPVKVLAVVYLALNFVIGERSQVLALVAAGVLVYRPYGRGRLVLHGALLAVVPLVFISDYPRTSPNTPAFADRVAHTEFAVPYNVLTDLESHPETRTRAPGVADRLSSWVPRFATVGERGDSLPEWYTKSFYPETASVGGGRGFSVYGEALLVAGPFGVFLVPPMLVVVGSVLDQLLCARRRKIFGYALCILAAPLLLYTLRSDTLAVLKLFVFGACAPLLALRIATGIRH